MPKRFIVSVPEQYLAVEAPVLVAVLHADLGEAVGHDERRLVSCKDALAGRNDSLKKVTSCDIMWHHVHVTKMQQNDKKMPFDI